METHQHTQWWRSCGISGVIAILVLFSLPEGAKALQFAASNLSQLQKQNNGTYPFWRVFRVIDGRDSLAAHGREMPVWGSVFQSPEGQHPVIEAGGVGRILSVNFYLQTLCQS